MPNRIPLIVNSSASQIQEISVGDTLDLSNCDIVGATNISTANATVLGDLTVNGNISANGTISFLAKSMILSTIIGI